MPRDAVAEHCCPKEVSLAARTDLRVDLAGSALIWTRADTPFSGRLTKSHFRSVPLVHSVKHTVSSSSRDTFFSLRIGKTVTVGITDVDATVGMGAQRSQPAFDEAGAAGADFNCHREHFVFCKQR